MSPPAALLSSAGGRQPAYVGLVAVAAIVLHAALIWSVTRHVQVRSMPERHQVEVQIVTPPKPPPPIEPPKPPPPKARVIKHPVPQIQTAAPDRPAVDTTPTEPPVAVAPPALAPPPDPPPESEPVTAPFGRAGYLNNPPPDYPAAAARQGWQGTVLLRVRVLSSGKVDGVEVQKSSGHKVLDEQAIGTVRGWLFAPSKRGATPIDGWAIVPIEFKLDT